MKIGLVLEGGGGKGAYEVGALKAFREFGIEFDVISGTSIGAINALFMALADVEQLESFWLNFEHKYTDIIKEQMSGFGEAEMSKMGAALKDTNVALTLAEDKGFIKKDIFTEDFKEIVKNKDLTNINKKFYVCSVPAIKNPEPKYFELNNCTLDEMIDRVFSSAALPCMFPPVKIDGIPYFDGGILDVTPISPTINNNCELIFTVYLHRGEVRVSNVSSDATIIPIVPTVDLGDTGSGTMDFSKKGAQWRMKLGYEDTCRVLNRLRSIWF